MHSVNELKSRIEALDEIATLPHVMAQIMAVTESEESTAEDLAEVISTDQALSAKLLKTVNSPFYGIRREILSVQDCVVMLGFNSVKQVATAISVFDTLGKGKDDQYDQQGLWRHSLAAATIANHFDLQHRPTNEEVRGAYLAGLLHDIGKAVLNQLAPDQMAAIMQDVVGGGTPYLEAEEKLLGVTHCHIGLWTATAWNFPPALTKSIYHHHSPQECPEPRILAQITHTADALANNLGYPSPGNPGNVEIDPGAVEAMGIDNEATTTIANLLERNAKMIQAVGEGFAS